MSRSPRKQQVKGAEPKTRGKGETKMKEKQPFMEDGPFSDVIITVGDKKFYSNSGVLAYNSPILMSTLTEDKSNETETKGQKGQQKGQKKGQTPCKNNKELDWSNMHYRDVYEMLSFIDPRVDADLTDEAAMRLLPLSEDFDMKQLRKACLSTLYDSFIGLQKGRRPGYIHIEITMQYLRLADQYERDHAGQKPDTSRSGMSLNSRKSEQGKKSLKALCVNELLANTDPFVGKLVADTDGLSKELKRFILEKKLNQVNMVLARERQARIDVSPLRKSILFRK